jgi:hypothetical protein
LRANVVTPGPEPRLHGYDVERDLARHYHFSDVSLLALSGELPSDEKLAAFDTAMSFLAPLSVAEAPTHAATLARLCGATSSGVLGVGVVALAERSHDIVSGSASLLSWLASPEQPLDPAYLSASEEDRGAVDRLREALAGRGVRVSALDKPLSRQSALLAVLWYAGLTRPAQMEAALVLASLASVVAEAHTHEVASFRTYPMQLPPFEYEDP